MARLAALAAGAGALAGRGLAAAEKLPLCDEAIVKETCQLIGDGDTTSRSDLEDQGLTSATPEQCEALWRAFGYSEDRVDCTSLCYTVVGFLSQSGEMPAQSDTACYEVDGRQHPVRHGHRPGSGCRRGRPRRQRRRGRGRRPPPWAARARPQEHAHRRPRPGHRLRHARAVTQGGEFVPHLPGPKPVIRREAVCCWGRGGGRRREEAARQRELRDRRGGGLRGGDRGHRARHPARPGPAHGEVHGQVVRPEFAQASLHQEEILRILNSVTHVLANANYIHDHSPDGCDEDTYAFVMPDPDRDARDENGKFKVFLCDLFMAKKKERRETLTHEASHHGTAFTDDVCAKSVMHYHKSKRNLKVLKVKSELDDPDVGYGDEVPVHWDGKVWDATVLQIRDHDEVVLNVEPEEECEELAYGRSECMSLARKAPLKALRNADSFCFFIQDLATNVD
ncbi:unnamed protein product [Prorocentrum cordatum]|uniref:Lysine-specific metallo-endopeptidase domain-containing protein n=1 Tax=Prorocentrum cordatum TaxID=2364126 RepID=A0ABN9WFZ0_9DINO|nr:unnamed protein product [Polarella glacialis]